MFDALLVSTLVKSVRSQPAVISGALFLHLYIAFLYLLAVLASSCSWMAVVYIYLGICYEDLH